MLSSFLRINELMSKPNTSEHRKTKKKIPKNLTRIGSTSELIILAYISPSCVKYMHFALHNGAAATPTKTPEGIMV